MADPGGGTEPPESRRGSSDLAIQNTPNAERYVLEADAMRRRQLRSALLHGTGRNWRENRRAWPGVVAGLVVVAIVIAALAVIAAFEKTADNQKKLEEEQEQLTEQVEPTPSDPTTPADPSDSLSSPG
jgi:hypothetical protein